MIRFKHRYDSEKRYDSDMDPVPSNKNTISTRLNTDRYCNSPECRLAVFLADSLYGNCPSVVARYEYF